MFLVGCDTTLGTDDGRGAHAAQSGQAVFRVAKLGRERSFARRNTLFIHRTAAPPGPSSDDEGEMRMNNYWSDQFWTPPVDARFLSRLRSYLRERVIPEAERLDRDDIYPLEIVRELAAEGFTRTLLPVEYGGCGDFRQTVAFFEELGYASGSVAASMIVILQAQTMLRTFGNETLKSTYLPKIGEGLALSYALTESAHGSDIRSLDTKAVRDGDHWVLNGEKSFITSGSKAELIVMLAETPKGVSVFAVPAGLPGLEPYEGKLSATFGLRNGPHVDIRLRDVRIPLDHLIGEEGKGVRQAATTLSFSRTHTAGICAGFARAAFDGALERARGRVAFGQTVLEFQGIQWYFAEMFADIEAARALAYRAADALNSGDDIDRYSSVAKWRSCQTATQVALTAMQICGAYGTAESTPFPRYLRDAKTYEIGAGSAEIMKNTIFRYISKKVAA
jgi:alkylation response protein AidB-like acyl-CoA dehydrogenase